MSKTIEENKFMCADKNNDKNKTNILPLPCPLSSTTLATVFLIAGKLL